MSDLPFVVQISINPTYILIFCIFITALLHFVLLRVYKLTEVNWKQVDYIWLISAALGLLFLSSDLNKVVSRTYDENSVQPRVESAYNLLRWHLETAVPVCIVYHKGELSPPDFDEREIESKALCELSKNMLNNMPPTIRLPFPTLTALGIKNITYPAKYETKYIKETNSLIADYAHHLKRHNEFSEKINSSDTSYRIIGSFFLAFALGLRVTKVTAEVNAARNKQ